MTAYRVLVAGHEHRWLPVGNDTHLLIRLQRRPRDADLIAEVNRFDADQGRQGRRLIGDGVFEPHDRERSGPQPTIG